MNKDIIHPECWISNSMALKRVEERCIIRSNSGIKESPVDRDKAHNCATLHGVLSANGWEDPDVGGVDKCRVVAPTVAGS